MPENWFQFKKFMLRQDEPVFRVGTDGVLLGAWSGIKDVGTVLDIGTGTGLLALMLAQRTNAGITAVEIDEASCRQAGINFDASPWKQRITLHHTAIQDFNSESGFDLVICNPPFFQNSKLPLKSILSRSKHNVYLSLAELAEVLHGLVNKSGRFCTVLPAEEAEGFAVRMESEGMHVHKTLKIKPRPDMEVKRLLIEFRFGLPERDISGIISIEQARRHDYTPEYRELTREFYLDF